MSNASDATARIANSTAEAACGYATAVFAAYADFARQSVGFWAQAIDGMMPQPKEPRSWYRHPDQRAAAAAPFPAPALTWMSWFNPALRGQHVPGWPATQPAIFNPFEFWLKAWPLEGNPAAWPMAFAMMGAGIPRSVAYPTAQANVAMMDAVTTANRVVEKSLSSYRTDGGHATAQILFKPEKLAALFVIPFGVELLAPWLGAIDAMQRGI